MAQQTSTAEPNRYAKAGYRRNSVWRSALIAIIVLIAFVAAIVAIDLVARPQLGGLTLVVAGIVLALVPAGIWLTFFYVQDRVEPEPLGSVARIFVIGLALAGAVGIPLTNQVFRVQDWLYRDTASMILGSLLIGAIEAFIIYAVVRYFIFNEPEFDERTDGVVYGTAAALGYATAINLQFILSSGGSALGGTEVYVAEVALAYAAFGGLLGYFLGHAKLERDPVWWLPLGLVLTALLNALFLILRGQLETGSISTASTAATLPSLTGLILAGILAIVVTVVVAFLVNRDIARSLAGKAAADPNATAGDRQSNYAVIAIFAVLLIIGAIGWNSAVNGTVGFTKGSVKGVYPAAYSQATTDKDVIRVSDRVGSGAEFAVANKTVEGDAKTAASVLAAERGASAVIYKVTNNKFTTVNGKPAFVQDFAYVDAGGFSSAVPSVIQGTDYIFMNGNTATIVTLYATPNTIGEVEPQFMQFLNSLTF